MLLSCEVCCCSFTSCWLFQVDVNVHVSSCLFCTPFDVTLPLPNQSGIRPNCLLETCLKPCIWHFKGFYWHLMLEPDCPALMSLKETERQLNITCSQLLMLVLMMLAVVFGFNMQLLLNSMCISLQEPFTSLTWL